MIDNTVKQAIHAADRYARRKTYKCLIPGCGREAVACHSIQRAACAESLAENGKVYTVRQSFNQFIENWDGTGAVEVVLEGLNTASTFDGFCPGHDSQLFSKAEEKERRTQRGMFQAFHLRAIALIYCRRRRSIDFMLRFSELVTDPRIKEGMKTRAEETRELYEIFRKLHFNSLVGILTGSTADKIFGFRIRFTRNLGVSCCGCFQQDPGDIRTVIGFNLVSHKSESELAVTTFEAVFRCVQDYERSYGPGTIGYQDMINDLAFSKCQEPLIAPPFWRSLSDSDRMAVGLSLRHPDVRGDGPIPGILRVGSNDILKHHIPDMTLPIPKGASEKEIISLIESARPDMKGKVFLKSIKPSA